MSSCWEEWKQSLKERSGESAVEGERKFAFYQLGANIGLRPQKTSDRPCSAVCENEQTFPEFLIKVCVPASAFMLILFPWN